MHLYTGAECPCRTFLTDVGTGYLDCFIKNFELINIIKIKINLILFLYKQMQQRIKLFKHLANLY